ncbi:MAG: IS30 family transposase [Coriobacteriales bacterium]
MPTHEFLADAVNLSEQHTAVVSLHAGRVATVTADGSTEFQSYAEIERATGTLFYVATPHRSSERGADENTNGLIQQYLPTRTSMAHVTQADLDAIARTLNTRPRKRLGFRTPEECCAEAI